MSNAELQKIIPHRYPFLLIDRIESVDPGKHAVGIKAVTINEPFFQGHFPGLPIMPGVLIAEALAQMAGVAALKAPELAGRLPFLAGLDKFRFRRSVVPGDVLRLEAKIGRSGRGAARVACTATVEGEVVAEGEVFFILIPPPVEL
ncbi:MAG: 3-hydroxyacyl-ACP dehydratase FabZ [Chloroflexota bacterium]|nr:3-hydroxyacyl-ACP dehydratase FabZ [Chloroflexota bacterium]